MAKKRGASQRGPRKAPGKKSEGRKPPNQPPPQITGREVGTQAKPEKFAAHYQAGGLPATGARPARQELQGQSRQGPAALTSAKFDARTFILACVAAAALAVAGFYWLSSIQEPVSEAFSTSAVRLN